LGAVVGASAASGLGLERKKLNINGRWLGTHSK